MTKPTRLYGGADIAARLDLWTSLPVVERTYEEVAHERVLNPSKLTMHMGDDGAWPDHDAFAIDMPAYVDWLDVAGLKWAVATWDADTDVPISSLILLFDLDRQVFTAVMEGMYLTGVRTALQSVVGLEHLYPGTPASVGVIGAGFMGRFQVRVIDHLLDIETFRVYDVDECATDALVDSVAPDLDASLSISDSAGEAAASDALITVTDSKTPVLAETALSPSTFLIGLGTYQELPDETILAADHVVVDHPGQCLQRGVLSDMAQRGAFAEADMDTTIGAVLAGESDLSVRADERVLFVPIGLGALDIALAEHLLRTDDGDSPVAEFDFT